MTVATAFAVSWNPLTNSNPSAIASETTSSRSDPRLRDPSRIGKVMRRPSVRPYRGPGDFLLVMLPGIRARREEGIVKIPRTWPWSTSPRASAYARRGPGHVAGDEATATILDDRVPDDEGAIRPKASLLGSCQQAGVIAARNGEA